MKANNKRAVIPQEIIERKISLLRGKQVMLDSDLAKLYGVQTKVLNQAVKRNRSRFPDDFMFQLTQNEYPLLRSQIVTLEEGRGKHRKYLPYVFTEPGIAMLSTVLNSDIAIQVTIQIIRTFIKIREVLSNHKDLKIKIENIEKEMEETFSLHNKQFKIVFKSFEEIKLLLNPPFKKHKRRIGFNYK